MSIVSQQIVALDVREDIRNGREPFSRIMAAVASLKAQEDLLIIAPFEPVPLYFVLEKQGFSHQSTRTGSGDWEVIFARRPVASDDSGPALISSLGSINSPADGFEVDARGLEPPQPMVRILETLASLPSNAVLEARTDRRPMHLYAQLEARGFKGETEEHPDGGFVTRIYKHRSLAS